MVDQKLYEWCNERQTEMLKALDEHGTSVAAGQKLDVKPDAIRSCLRLAKKRAARQGYSPEHNQAQSVPDGYHTKGVSTLYSSDGTVKQQWVKSAIDPRDPVEAMREVLVDLTERNEGRSSFMSPPAAPSERELLAVYPMGDPHVGLLTWKDETGKSFDLSTAQQQLCAAIDYLVDRAPAAEHALIANLGDFYHCDSNAGVTLRSGNKLDTDGRWAKILQVGVDIMVYLVECALKKHQSVRVINAIGNHDDHSSVMLSLVLAAYFRNNPRVEIDTSPAPFHYYRFGEVLIGVHHGHNTKAEKLPGVMAVDRAQDWGETTHRHWLTGHIHHDTLKEMAGCTVETFRTLAPADHYAHSHGYRAQQDMKCDIYHRRFGRVERTIFSVDRTAP